MFKRTLSGVIFAVLFEASGAAAQTDRPPAPSPTPAAVASMIGQLRLIGSVRAKTRFCSALETSAGSAARSSVAYEALLYRTTIDFGSLRLDDPLRKATSMEQLERDVRTLGILATTGRRELDGLRRTVAFAPAGGAKAAIAVRDAMDGAKARQYELAKQLAGVVATLGARRLYTTIDLPSDNVGGALVPLDESFFDNRQGPVLDEASKGVAIALPDNDGIVHDLRVAAANAEAALKAGNCLPASVPAP